MKKIGVYWLAAILLLFLSGGYVWAGENPPEAKVGHRHWVYDELAAFKQSFIPVVHDSTGRITDEEKKILQEDIFNVEKLDQAIEVKHWALLLRIVLNLPGERVDQLLDMYVYGLASGNTILREDAAGGVVKLLTVKYLSGSASAAELEQAKALLDLDNISEKQRDLVRKAYCEGILDGTVNDYFRPKEELTNAEAVSMLYRVICKYEIDFNDMVIQEKSQIPASDLKEHWASIALKKSLEGDASRVELLKGAERIIMSGNPGNRQDYLEQPIPVEIWNDLLMETLGLPNDRYEKNFLEGYTYGLSEGEYITRGSAVAGMVKLLHAAELVGARDATEEEKNISSKRFYDYDKAWDQSKLAIAYSEGLILGNGDGTFKPERLLTYGEALTLAVRIIEKYY